MTTGDMARPIKTGGLGRGLSALFDQYHAPTPTSLQQPLPLPATLGGERPMASPDPYIDTPPTEAEIVTLAPAALAVDAAPAPVAQGHGPQWLPIAKIQRNPGQPRQIFAQEELAELADSIARHGILQPILVRRLGDTDSFEIIAGERRFRAAQAAGLDVIPALVRASDDLEVLEIAMIENIQRTDLNPLEEAQGYQTLITKFGRTPAQVAEAVGKSRAHISNMMRLLGLPDDVQEHLRAGRLAAGHARAVANAPNPSALAARIIAEGMNVREAEKLANDAKDEVYGAVKKLAADVKPAKSADVLSLELDLSRVLGLEVDIKAHPNGGGELRVSFTTMAELDDLCRRMTIAARELVPQAEAH